MAERLNKRIAASGLTSRRGAEEYIRAGQVMVNDKIVTDLATIVERTDTIAVNGKVLTIDDKVTYAFYKPRGVVCSREQQGDAPIITDLLPANPAVYPIGRLDKDSEGLIFLTNDGNLAQRLSHPKFEHQKEYAVVGFTKEEPNSEHIREKLLQGVELEDGLAKADDLRITKEGDKLRLVFTVHEGRNRLIRRMCAAVGVHVDTLTRTRIGVFQLGELKAGEWRELTMAELGALS